MPPKAKKKAPPPTPAVPPLKDCHIAFVKLAALNGKSTAEVKAEIAKLGGTFVSKIDQCTHLVATQQQFDSNSARVKEAVSQGNANIVTYEWLEESFDASGKVDETKYLLNSSTTSVQADSKTSPKASGKRSRTSPDNDDDDKSTASKKVKAEANESNKSTKAIKVPLDEALHNTAGYEVVIGDDGTIFDVTLNQTNAGNNNNKFYRIQLLIDNKSKYYTWTRWGRVGEMGQSKMLGDGDYDLALKEFHKKFKDKNGNSWEKRLDPIKSGKYAYIERSYEDSDDEDDDRSKAKKNGSVKEEDEEEAKPVESKLEEPVQRLMKLIFNQDYFNSTLASLDYDANKMPLGKLSKNTLLRGYTVLKELTALANTGQRADLIDKSNQYFSLIPHDFGRNRPPVLDNMQMIKKEIELLESLTDMQLANDIMKHAKTKKKEAEQINVLDRQFQGLGLQEMTPLDPKSTEFKDLESYLLKSKGDTHYLNYKVEDIFRIERKGEHGRFDDSKFAKINNSDRRLLWHGSRCTNFGGILSQGLRIAPPEAPVSGYMFGKGIYLADMSSKSANYCCHYSTGNTGLLLLCEAELGKPPLKLTGSNYNAGTDAAKQGSISTWGVGTTAPTGWKDAGSVHKSLRGISMPDVVGHKPGPTNEPGAGLLYNEYIVYDVAQVKLRYLLRCKM